MPTNPMTPEAIEWLRELIRSPHYPAMLTALKDRAAHRNEPMPTAHEQTWCSGYAKGYEDFPSRLVELAFEEPAQSTEEFVESQEPDFADQEPNAQPKKQQRGPTR